MNNFNWDHFNNGCIQISKKQFIRNRITTNNLSDLIIFLTSDQLTFFTWLISCKYFGLEKDFIQDYKKLRKEGLDIGLASTHAGLGWIK